MTLQIRNIRTEEWEDAMALVWRTFLKYEACDYEEEGVRSFLDFITDERLKKLHMIGEYPVMAAFCGQKMVGVASMRSINHISLLFVDSKNRAGAQSAGAGSCRRKKVFPDRECSAIRDGILS